jgi:hypothetical protein
MKEAILAEIKPFCFQHTLSKVSGLLDQYRESAERPVTNNDDETAELLRDQVKHLLRALTMISEVPETIEGATMAKGIAAEAVSTLADGRSG